jgi:hypothetical protein
VERFITSLAPEAVTTQNLELLRRMIAIKSSLKEPLKKTVLVMGKRPIDGTSGLVHLLPWNMNELVALHAEFMELLRVSAPHPAPTNPDQRSSSTPQTMDRAEAPPNTTLNPLEVEQLAESGNPKLLSVLAQRLEASGVAGLTFGSHFGTWTALEGTETPQRLNAPSWPATLGSIVPRMLRHIGVRET